MALLGLIAYQELTAFEHLSSDARLSPTLVDRETLARLAVTEFGRYELIREIIASRGMDAQEVIEPFVASIDEMHKRTEPLWQTYAKPMGDDAVKALADYRAAIGSK